MLAENALCGLICSLNGFGYICKQVNSGNKVLAIEYILQHLTPSLSFSWVWSHRKLLIFAFLSSGSLRFSNQTALMEAATQEDLYVPFFSAYHILIWWFIVRWFSPCCFKNVNKILRRSIDLYWPINCILLVPILPHLYFSSPLLLTLPLFFFPWLFFLHKYVCAEK